MVVTMPPRSKIDMLPKDVREELERRLIKGAFSNYRGLTQWLADEGFEISKTSLNNWGQDFENRLGSLRNVTEQARVIVAENPDDDGAVNDALLRLTQEKVFLLLTDLNMDLPPAALTKVTRAVADLSRAAVSQKRLMAEAKRQAREDAAKGATEAGKELGLSDETIDQIRSRVLGVAS
jgi:AraC-like DNA-binding protein